MIPTSPMIAEASNSPKKQLRQEIRENSKKLKFKKFLDIPDKGQEKQFFRFDRVFKHTSSNEDVYKMECEPIIAKCLHGFDCCVVSYGGPESGAADTMVGNQNDPGMI